MRTVRHSYGTAASQFVTLMLPDGPGPFPVVVLLHGGFWHLPWGCDLMTGPAEDLVGRGLAVWNLEYRRVGEAGGGWPGTFEDVLSGFDLLANVAEAGRLNLGAVAVAGHSAGGHLALWLAAQRGPVTSGAATVDRVVALAAVTDLVQAWEWGVGTDAVEALLGGPPHRNRERYRLFSPAELLPLGVRQLLLHGERDRVVPPGLSRAYAERAAAAGDDVTLRIAPRTGHMDVIDPRRPQWQSAARWMATTANPGD